jgi:uncharacterized protein
MDSVVHFEMPYDDPDRMSAFYEAAFGWRTQMLGGEMADYVLATTVETDETGPVRPGAINGGFFRRDPASPGQHPSVVIAVDDVDEAARKIAEAGGRLLAEPMDIPGVGRYLAIQDPEGNHLGVLQPVPRNWHAPEGEPPAPAS